jgi:hypothetical protein
MYWLCYDHNDPRYALIIYAAAAPGRYDQEYGYETQAEADEALHDALEQFYEWEESHE